MVNDKNKYFTQFEHKYNIFLPITGIQAPIELISESLKEIIVVEADEVETEILSPNG